LSETQNRQIFFTEAQKGLIELDERIHALEFEKTDSRAATQLFNLTRRFQSLAEKAGLAEAQQAFTLLESLLNIVLRSRTELSQKIKELLLGLLSELRAVTRPESAVSAAPVSSPKLQNLLTLMQDIHASPDAQPGAEGKSGFILKIGDLLVREGLVSPEKVQSALAQQKHLKEVRKEKEAGEASSSILVSARNLDVLVNLIGELITLQTRLNQLITIYPDQEVIGATHGIEQLTNNMRETAMNIRMIGVGTLFSRYRRMVRDVAEKSGKEVDFSSEGGELELDKTVIEVLEKPLAELIEFCILYDLETVDERKGRGKAPRGLVHIVTENRSGQAFFRIQTDGAGMDLPAVTALAQAHSLQAITQESHGETDLNLLFRIGCPQRSGKPASEKLTNALPFIKKAIDEMRGSIELRNRPEGGLEFALMLPFTLAIFHGLQVTIGEHSFLLPLFSVQECVEKKTERPEERRANGLTLVRGEMIPFISLRHLLGTEGPPPPQEYIVITTIDRRRVGFVVDRIIGELQTVIKPLGKFLQGAEWFYGATILGDGTIALILNIVKLSQRAELLEMKA
jgi:two-component system chemotaxis sensor kinase CheA